MSGGQKRNAVWRVSRNGMEHVCCFLWRGQGRPRCLEGGRACPTQSQILPSPSSAVHGFGDITPLLKRTHELTLGSIMDTSGPAIENWVLPRTSSVGCRPAEPIVPMSPMAPGQNPPYSIRSFPAIKWGTHSRSWCVSDSQPPSFSIAVCFVLGKGD